MPIDEKNSTAGVPGAASTARHSGAWAGVRSGILLLAVLGGIAFGVTRVNPWFTSTRGTDLAPIRVVLPVSPANYAPQGTQSMNMISVSFDQDGATTAATVDFSPPRIAPLRQVPVTVGLPDS